MLLRIALPFAVAVVVALSATACNRAKDPYERFKPAQLLDEGQRLLRQGDAQSAEKVMELGLARAMQASARAEALRELQLPLIHLAVKSGDLAKAEKRYAEMGGLRDARATHQLMVLRMRAGRGDEALRLAEQLAETVDLAGDEDDALTFRAAAWTSIDRVRIARFRREDAKGAAQGVLAALAGLAAHRGGFRPLPSPLRPWLVRYVDHLFDTDRRLLGTEVADVVARIDENAAPAPAASDCIAVQPGLPELGCLLELG